MKKNNSKIILIKKKSSKFKNYKFNKNKNKQSKNKRNQKRPLFIIIAFSIKNKILFIFLLSLFLFLIIFFKYFTYHKLIWIKSLSDKEKKYNKFFFFEENQDSLDYCKNYSIMVYDYCYNGVVSRYPGNIGDYIQSLAALQYLPKNCKPYFIDRDSIQIYNGPKVNLIMNGWYFIIEGNKNVSTKINPIFLSYHINNSKKLPDNYINDLKKYSPIGCRDLQTKDQLNKLGINAFFSSCLTTTLDIDYAVKESERNNEIIFIEYKFGQFPLADKFILSLKSYNFSNITYTNHGFNNTELTHIDRFKLAKKLLDKYARAKLVVSKRLHGALPCLGFNTPVILVNKDYDFKRFPGLYELLNTIGKNSKRQFEIRVNVDSNGFVYNPKNYSEYANFLKNKLKNI